MSQQTEIPFNDMVDNRTKPLKIRDMPPSDQPLYRLQHAGPSAISLSELLTIIIGSQDFDPAHQLVKEFGTIEAIKLATVGEISAVDGIGQVKAARIKAAIELGRRMQAEYRPERPKVSSPADAANLVMSEMQSLEQEELRVILLNTRNDVLCVKTVYIGSVNTSVLRVSEIFRHAIRINAVGIILVHNHPSGDPAPSPEDISVTRQIHKAGELMDLSLLDHIIIGHRRFVSLKERQLGFD